MVVSLEVAVVGLMKSNQDRHDLTDGQGSSALSMLVSAGQQLVVPDGQKRLAEIIDIAE